MIDGVELVRDRHARIAEVRLSSGRGNVLGRTTCERLAAVFADLGADHGINAVLLSASGNDFCYGASVAEHMPDKVEAMLSALHGLAQVIVDAAVPVCALVQGRCLGGGLELALCAHRIIVARGATLGLPEVTLGVFPPLGATLLPFRISQPLVDRMIVEAEVLDAEAALDAGLADELTSVTDLSSRGRLWASKLAAMSASSVRLASTASRLVMREALGARLTRLEALYLTRLLPTHDGVEGIRAFVEKRPAQWQHR